MLTEVIILDNELAKLVNEENQEDLIEVDSTTASVATNTFRRSQIRTNNCGHPHHIGFCVTMSILICFSIIGLAGLIYFVYEKYGSGRGDVPKV